MYLGWDGVSGLVLVAWLTGLLILVVGKMPVLGH